MSRSPKILHLSRGEMEVEGIGPGKDFKLYPGGGRVWDWTENGTQHTPGILPADVAELLSHGARLVVLSRGMDLKLHIDPSTIAMLEQAGVSIHSAETTEAVRIYNLLADSEPVGGLFHSTC
jgi:hypothetical protein